MINKESEALPPITCLSEGMELLLKAKQNPETGKWETTWIFRGHTNVAYEIIHSLGRTYVTNSDIPGIEYKLCRNFSKYIHEQHPRHQFDWLNIAILGQHYKLPTRLIDWTYNPLVALWMATQSPKQPAESEVSRAIFVLDLEVWREQAISSDQRKCLEDYDARVFTPDMLKSIGLNPEITTLKEFRQSMHRSSEHVLICDPPPYFPRIVNQASYFMIPTNSSMNTHERISQIPSLLKKYKIPAWAVQRIHDELQAINLSARVMYPGLEGVAMSLRDRYYPRNN
jgi:hypothetical protein